MRIVLSILAYLALAYTASANVVITGFGTGEFTSTFSDFTNTQTSTTFQIVGSDLGSQLNGTVPSINIAGNTLSLLLTASFSGTATSNFQIQLLDTSNNSRTYQASFSAFTQGTEVSVPFTLVTSSGVFNNNVSQLGFYTSGGGSSVNLTMNTLTAVPEPSSYCLLLLSSIISASWIYKRRAIKTPFESKY